METTIFATTVVNGGALLCLKDKDIDKDVATEHLNKFLEKFKNEKGVNNIYHLGFGNGKYFTTVYHNTNISDICVNGESLTTTINSDKLTYVFPYRELDREHNNEE